MGRPVPYAWSTPPEASARGCTQNQVYDDQGRAAASAATCPLRGLAAAEECREGCSDGDIVPFDVGLRVYAGVVDWLFKIEGRKVMLACRSSSSC